jgi:hypothetical protein
VRINKLFLASANVWTFSRSFIVQNKKAHKSSVTFPRGKLTRKIASIHFLQPDFVIRKRIANNYSVVSGNQNDALKKLHKFGCGVRIAFADRFKIHFKIGDKH